MSHTPGPWKATRIFIENQPDRMVIKVNKWQGAIIADCGTFAECDLDNAHLLASAPKLLAACKECLDLLTHCPTVTLEGIPYNSKLWINQLREAIGQAEERSPNANE